MQPLDVAFMKPLETYYAQVIVTWLGSNPGHVVTSFVVCKLFGSAYRRASTLDVSVNSFIKIGLLILSFRRVLYVVRFLLGISPASEC